MSPANESTHVDLLYPSKYLRAADLMGRDVTVTIASIKRDELQMKGGIKEMRVVMTFQGKEKAFVVNKTNKDTIKKLWGNYTSGWIGKPITLFPTTDKLGRETVDCIRVRPTKPTEKVTKTAAEAMARTVLSDDGDGPPPEGDY